MRFTLLPSEPQFWLCVSRASAVGLWPLGFFSPSPLPSASNCHWTPAAPPLSAEVPLWCHLSESSGGWGLWFLPSYPMPAKMTKDVRLKFIPSDIMQNIQNIMMAYFWQKYILVQNCPHHFWHHIMKPSTGTGKWDFFSSLMPIFFLIQFRFLVSLSHLWSINSNFSHIHYIQGNVRPRFIFHPFHPHC